LLIYLYIVSIVILLLRP